MVTRSVSPVQVLGPARIYTGVVASEVELGHTTDDGIEVTYEPDWGDPVIVDQFGDTPVDYVLVGQRVMVKAIFAQFENAVLDEITPAATVNSAGSPPFTVGGTVGLSAASVAKRLVVRPEANVSGPDRSQDIVLYKAFAHSGYMIPVQLKNQVGLEVTFFGLLDTTRPDGNMLWGIGDDEL